MSRSPSRRLLGTSVGLLLAATAIACQSSAPHPARAVDRAPSRVTYFPQYGASTHAYKPRRLNPSVDGSLYLRGMRWTAWDDRHAVGAGVAHVNTCRPDCADGQYATYRVAVRLTQPRALCGSRFFTTIRVSGPGYRTYGHKRGVGCR